jgi:hypothetical protein
LTNEVCALDEVLPSTPPSHLSLSPPSSVARRTAMPPPDAPPREYPCPPI